MVGVLIISQELIGLPSWNLKQRNTIVCDHIKILLPKSDLTHKSSILYVRQVNINYITFHSYCDLLNLDPKTHYL